MPFEEIENFSVAWPILKVKRLTKKYKARVYNIFRTLCETAEKIWTKKARKLRKGRNEEGSSSCDCVARLPNERTPNLARLLKFLSS